MYKKLRIKIENDQFESSIKNTQIDRKHVNLSINILTLNPITLIVLAHRTKMIVLTNHHENIRSIQRIRLLMV